MRFTLLLAAVTFAGISPQNPQLVRRDVPPASISYPERQSFEIRSQVLGQTRRVFVAVPPSFAAAQPTRRFPVVIVTDGEGRSAASVVTAVTELSRSGLMPEAVVVGIENQGPANARVFDLTPPGLSVSGSNREQGGDRFLDFIEQELLPALDRDFRTAAPRVLVGHSSGGVLATYAAATRDTFRLVVALDTPAHLDGYWLGTKLITRAQNNPPPVRYASINARFGWSDARWAEVAAAAPASWRLHQEKTPGETHNSLPLVGAYIGLREVFTEYSRLSAPEYPTTSILPYYASLAAIYGGPVDPPQALMSDVVDDLLIEGRGTEARAAFDRLVALYGEPPDAARRRAEIDEVSKQPPPRETVESLLATPFPSPQEAAPLLGTWDGVSGPEGIPGQPFTLDVKVEDGRVTGTVTMRPEPAVELVMRLQYLAMRPDGFTYGYMNGMRPRGMLLYPMTRRDGDYLGEMTFGGVTLRPPDGWTPPRIVVRLRKRQ